MSEPTGPGPRESLAAILAIEGRGDGEFVCQLEDFWGDSIGGDILARAVLGAAEGGDGTELHSLHACFVRSAPPSVPVKGVVEPLEGSTEFVRKQVRLLHDGLLCHLVVTFAAPTKGPEYQDGKLDPGLPAPDTLPTTDQQARADGWPEVYARGPIEFRRVGPLWPDNAKGQSWTHTEWVRPRIPLPNDRRLHMAALVFLSDFYSHWPFERRIGRSFAYERFRTIDHTLWVHRFVPWDDWWLVRATSEVGGAGRALARRELYTRAGVLVASAVTAARVATTGDQQGL